MEQRPKSKIEETMYVKQVVGEAILEHVQAMGQEKQLAILGTADTEGGVTVSSLISEGKEKKFATSLMASGKTEELRTLLSNVILTTGLRPDDMYEYYFEPIFASVGIFSGLLDNKSIRGLAEKTIKDYPELVMVMMLEQQNLEVSE